MKILITGISDTGKSSVVEQLSKRGFAALDADTISQWIDTNTNNPDIFGLKHSYTPELKVLISDAGGQKIETNRNINEVVNNILILSRA